MTIAISCYLFASACLYCLPGTLKDVALEFGMCVPSSCSYPVVDTVFVPYLLGRYMGKNWGPKTLEILTRWHKDTEEVDKEDTASHFMFKVVALYPGGAAAWYQEEWPFRQEVKPSDAFSI